MAEMSTDESLQMTRCCNIMLDLIIKYGVQAKKAADKEVQNNAKTG